MRAIVCVVLLATVLLVTAALAGEISTTPEQAEHARAQTENPASRTVSSDQSLNAFVQGTPSRGMKAETPGLMNYQGTLTDAGGIALDTTVAMTFSIYTDSVGGAQVWTETQPSVEVTGGIFSVLLGRVNTIADTVFNDPQRWLGVQVGGDPELVPRQRIAAVGYAFWAAEADTAGYARSGAGGGTDNDWVRGTPDSVLFTANNLGIARGGAGNVLYGDSVHTHINFGVACTTGAPGVHESHCTISGGLNNTASDDWATVGGGKENIASGHYAVVGGGHINTASGMQANIDCGWGNTASGDLSTIGGGSRNTASAEWTTVGGGQYNTASEYTTTVGGGYGNDAIGYAATITGGMSNAASGIVSIVGGGWINSAGGDYSAILGGCRDTITASGDYSYLFGINSKLTADSTFMVDMPHIRFGDETDGYEFPPTDGSSGQVLVTDGGGALSWQAGADNDWVRGTPDSVLFTANYLGIARGGADNRLYGFEAHTHINLGVACTTGVLLSDYSFCTVGGGVGNTASNYDATVSGGYRNTASGWDATVSGGYRNTASGSNSTVGGGKENTASVVGATIGGGSNNIASSDNATVGGGENNTANNYNATVGGGYNNTASGFRSTVGGGYNNTASEFYAAVGGGTYNTASGWQAIVSGGYHNTAGGRSSIVGGGNGNFVAGECSAILGGYRDTVTAAADYSYLFGIESKLTEDSTFMVDMPHIRFGDETDGYEFPPTDGSGGQVLVTDGGGALSWQSSTDNDWVRGTPDSVLFTANSLGIARGDAGNMLYGNAVHTHINLGVACTTGVSGGSTTYSTVGGGSGNTASGYSATVSGGYINTASGDGATVGGGVEDTASAYGATVGGGNW